MNLNLDYYIKTYSKLDVDECKTIIDSIQENEWTQHEYHNPAASNWKSENEFDVSYTTNIHVYELVMQRIWGSYLQYTKDLNFKWWNSWSGFSNVRFNRYHENQIMESHCDHIHTLFEGQNKGIPIMTALGILNDDYEGGEIIMFDEMHIPVKTGDILIFPSNFLYPHKVNPIKSGIRYSFVSWAW